tara:strand:- start:333 stop:914 length:582 start_codon:yes stop_codon:yes gene_type:complete
MSVTTTYNGTQLELFPFAPEWSGGVEVSYEYKTDVREALNQAEERNQMLPRPLVSIKYRLQTLDEQQTIALREFQLSQDETPVLFPLWHDFMDVTSAVSAGSNVTVNHTRNNNMVFDEYRPYWSLWSNYSNAEAVEATTYNLQSTIFSTVDNNYQVGDKIFPLAVGLLKILTLKTQNGEVAGADINFEEKYLY